MENDLVFIVCLAIFIILMTMFWPRFVGGAEWAPASMKIVRKMLRMAKVSRKDIVYDLGCGDGRFVLTALREFNAKSAVGIEIDPLRCFFSKIRTRKFKNAKIKFGSFVKKDLNEATVITCFLRQKTNDSLREKLSQLKPGTKIVSYIWKFSGWKPVKADKKNKVYMYEIGKS